MISYCLPNGESNFVSVKVSKLNKPRVNETAARDASAQILDIIKRLLVMQRS